MSVEPTPVDRRTHPFAIIPNEVDDFGLDPYAFRVYARLARRAGRGGAAWESVENMAEACGMGTTKLKESLRELERVGLIERTERPGETSVYTLLDTPTPRVDHPADPDATRRPPRRHTSTTPTPHVDKEEPMNKNPLKEIRPSRMSADADELENTKDASKLKEPHYQAFADAWNEHRGDLPKVLTLNSTRRSKIRTLVRNLGLRDALAATAIGAAEVAADPFWQRKGYGFDNLLNGQKVVQKAETAVSRGTPDRGQAQRDRMLSALEGL